MATPTVQQTHLSGLEASWTRGWRTTAVHFSLLKEPGRFQPTQRTLIPAGDLYDCSVNLERMENLPSVGLE